MGRSSFASQATELMSVIFLLISASTVVAGLFVVAFILAVRDGQFDDDRSPAVRILNDTTPRDSGTNPSPNSPAMERGATPTSR